MILNYVVAGRMTDIENIDNVLADGIKDPVLMLPITEILI